MYWSISKTLALAVFLIPLSANIALAGPGDFKQKAPGPGIFAINGCCQDTPDGGKHCGAPITVLGKKTCTLGWYKVSCDKGYTNCKKETWSIVKPNQRLKIKQN